jgi:hypothetical protein
MSVNNSSRNVHYGGGENLGDAIVQALAEGVLECCKSSLDAVTVKCMHAGGFYHSSLLTLRDYAAPDFGAKQPLTTIKRNLVLGFIYSIKHFCCQEISSRKLKVLDIHLLQNCLCGGLLPEQSEVQFFLHSEFKLEDSVNFRSKAS